MTRLALCDVSGPLTDLFQKLSGEDGEQWTRALNKMLRKENPWEGPPVWKTIKLGMPGLKSADDLRKSIEDSGMKITDCADDMLDKPAFTVAAEETEVDLVKISVAELGFTGSTRYDKICERAKEFGLQLCPNEVGPQLRRQYNDQPKGEWIRVAMEAIRGSDGGLGLFNVAHGDCGLWLSSLYGDPGYLFFPGGLFVFVRPRK